MDNVRCLQEVFTHMKLWNKSVSLALSFEFRLEIKLVDIEQCQESESVVEKCFLHQRRLKSLPWEDFFQINETLSGA